MTNTKRAYQIVNGTSYDANTSQEVINLLEDARINRTRIVLDYGDIETGQSWGEVFDITGYVGRSNGTIQVPILLYNSASIGGGSILDKCIVKIMTSKGKNVLYQHPKYKAYEAPKKDEYITKVIFRKYKNTGEILALFPYDVERDYSVTCYQHVGQHGSADYQHCISITKPATEAEAKDLKAELEGLGYNLDVGQRRNHNKYIDAHVQAHSSLYVK